MSGDVHLTFVSLTSDAQILGEALARAITHERDESGLLFTEVIDHMLREIYATPAELLEKSVLVVADIAVSQPWKAKYHKGRNSLWAVCRKEAQGTIFVAREELNGTLVLIRQEHDKLPRIVGYLTRTTQESGTYLIPVDKQGVVKMDVERLVRSDLFGTHMLKPMKWWFELELEPAIHRRKSWPCLKRDYRIAL